MTKEPEDPFDNPWDDNDKKAEKTKDPIRDEKTYNPWQHNKNSQPSNDKKTPPQNSADVFDFLLKRFQKSQQKFSHKNDNNIFNGFGINNNGGSGGSNITMLGIIGIAAVIGWLSSGIFRVQETDQAVILRLGKFRTIVGPGLQYRLPYPFEKEIIKNVSSNNVMQSSDRLLINRNNYDKSDQTLVLTGDENIIHISYTVTWKIKNLQEYLFTVRNPDNTILAATESIIREVIGQTDALPALTDERSTISQKASSLLQKVMDQYKIGVQIVQVQLQRVEPPKEVLNAFNDMQASLTDGDGLRIKAEAYRSEVVPKSRGDASKIIQEAEGYAQQVISRATGEADRFTSIYEQYKKNPEVSSKRLYLDTMENILTKTQKTIVDSKAAPGIVPYVNLQSHDKK